MASSLPRWLVRLGLALPIAVALALAARIAASRGKPMNGSESQAERISISHQYHGTQAARQAWRALVWQVPAIALAAEAVLITVVAGGDAADEARLGAAFLALVVIVVALQLFLRHGHLQNQTEIWLGLIEEEHSLEPISRRGDLREILKARAVTDEEMREGDVSYQPPFSWFGQWPSRLIWATTLLSIAIGNLALVGLFFFKWVT
jgi:hypothetical protein